MIKIIFAIIFKNDLILFMPISIPNPQKLTNVIRWYIYKPNKIEIAMEILC